MKNSTLTIGLIVIVGIISVAAFSFLTSADNQPAEEAEAAIVYKSPNCGCCSVYASYLNNQDGYDVETKNLDDMTSIKTELGVPQELGSCHTMEIGGYVIEGHIPEAAVEKLLSEQPDIKGIGMPGMPAGSPGMPGPKTEDFVVYEITNSGEKGDVFMRI